MCSSAGAGLPRKHADVTGTVTKKRERLLVKAGEYKLALLALGERLACFGVDNLREEVVLTDVHSVLLGAFVGYAGA